MRDAQPNAIYLKDYQQPGYWIEQTDLTFELQAEYTLVTANLHVVRNAQVDGDGSLRLDGQQLELISVAVDGLALESHQ